MSRRLDDLNIFRVDNRNESQVRLGRLGESNSPAEDRSRFLRVINRDQNFSKHYVPPKVRVESLASPLNNFILQIWYEIHQGNKGPRVKVV